MFAALAVVLPLALAIDAEPPTSDLWAFPHPAICSLNVQHAIEYLQYLDALAPIYPTYYGEWEDVRRDVLWRLQAWQSLQWCWSCPEDSRRGALGRLRECLGAERYAENTMPPPWPVRE